MPAAFTREEVLRVAILARLTLTDEEISLYANQLSEILDYVGRLRESLAAERTAEPATEPTGPSWRTAERADTPRLSLGRDEALANAPDASNANGLFRVPRVIE